MQFKEYTLPFAYQIIRRNKIIQNILPIPKDFEFAALLIHAYEKFDKQLLGILKVYYPVNLVRIQNSKYLIFDEHQFVSSVLEMPFFNKKIDTIVNLISQVESDISLSQILLELNDLKCKLETRRILGLFPPQWVREVQSIIGYAQNTPKEDFSIILENPKIQKNDVVKIYDALKKDLESIRAHKELLQKLKKELIERFNSTMRKIDLEIDMWNSRYNGELYQIQSEVEQRVRELELKMNEEIKKIIQWRDYNLWYYQTYLGSTRNPQIQNIRRQAELSIRSIRERYSRLITEEQRKIHDIERRKMEVIQPLVEKKAHLNNLYAQVLQQIESIISDLNVSIHTINNHLLTYNFEEPESVIRLLIPVYVILNKEKIEKSLVYTLMRLKKEKKVSFFHSYEFPFEPLDMFWEQFGENLRYRIRTELTLLSQITAKINENNLFLFKEVWDYFEKGVNVLQLNGWLKKQELALEISKLFVIKEKAISSKKLSKKSEAIITGITSEESKISELKSGEIILKIIDNEKKPVSDANVIINNKKYTVEPDGTVTIKIPAGTYNIIVSAEGYKPKEEKIRVFPDAYTSQLIQLDRVSLSEMLPDQLQEIISIAKKRGFKSLAVEGKVKEVAKLLKVDENKIWRELYSYLIQEWIRKGKKKQAIETALLFLAKQSDVHGGVMPLADVVLEIQSMGVMASSNDIEEVIRKLVKEKLVYGIKEVEGIKMVFFKGIGLSGDYKVVLDIAAKHNGELTKEQILLETGWSNDHAELVLNYLEENGLAISGTVKGKKVWWFPAFYKRV
ncbi:MAG: PEGA domain-containing protein [Candidatus Asgardarchaeia archaeon]